MPFATYFPWAAVRFVSISFAKAGSRGGLLALGAMVAVMFVLSAGKQRVLICAIGCAAVVSAMAFLPDYLRARYFTIFSATQNLDAAAREQLESDIAWADERQALLQ